MMDACSYPVCNTPLQEKKAIPSWNDAAAISNANPGGNRTERLVYAMLFF
jgi:hypothetical protein